MNSAPNLIRRRLLAAGVAGSLGGLTGCTTPLPLTAGIPASQDDAERLLLESAQAHGLAAYRGLQDINVRYTGEWRAFVDRVQPVVVDKAYRGSSEERILPAAGIVAQAYSGTAGRKQVAWQRQPGQRKDPGQVSVWFNGQASADPEVLSAASLVAEGYGLFLLGPLWLVGRGHTMQRGGSEQVDGRPCEVVQVWLQPGLGQVALDRVAVCMDAKTHLTRRVRFTLEGHAATQGAVAQVDTFDHQERHGVMWPMRFFEKVVHPLPLPAHDWKIAGLDVDRGYTASDVLGPAFTGAASLLAAAL